MSSASGRRSVRAKGWSLVVRPSAWLQPVGEQGEGPGTNGAAGYAQADTESKKAPVLTERCVMGGSNGTSAGDESAWPRSYEWSSGGMAVVQIELRIEQSV